MQTTSVSRSLFSSPLRGTASWTRPAGVRMAVDGQCIHPLVADVQQAAVDTLRPFFLFFCFFSLLPALALGHAPLV